MRHWDSIVRILHEEDVFVPLLVHGEGGTAHANDWARALALEFELGADILGTAISPSWDQIGKLGVVAVIRTGLNFFLSMEMKGEKTVAKGEAAPMRSRNLA